MDKLKWKKIIIKDRMQTADGKERRLTRIYITLCNAETGHYLISPVSDFLNEFVGRKPVTVAVAADIVARFLNYAFFTKNKTIQTLTVQDGIDFLNSIAGTANKKTQGDYSGQRTGMERGIEYGLEQIYNVMDSRYVSKKPLIATTNLTLEQLRQPEDVPHARIYGRLLEMCVPVRFTGADFRKVTAQQKMERLKKLMEMEGGAYGSQ